MTTAQLTVFNLIDNMRKHLDDARGQLIGSKTNSIVDTLHGDLDTIERLLNSILCDLRVHVDRI